MQASVTSSVSLPWRHLYSDLGAPFHTPVNPTPLSQLHWVAQNRDLANSLGLPPDFWSEPTLQALGGSAVLPGSQPLASVYSGHQFGVWAGQLGDGRALFLGDMETPSGHQELQLKGAGLTPFSRMGDGRAVLRSSIREYLCSEAMHGLGIPTTRALSLVASPDKVLREELETAAVVTRVAPSFLRFGHFQHFAAAGQVEHLKRLADFLMSHHLPDLLALPEGAVRYAGLLARVSRLTAEMVAHWQAVGFCHGVMNTDNMSMLGLTIDYGPFQFLDGFNPDHICNHSDHQGRYAYARQPQVAYWNLHALGQALMPLIDDQDMAIAAIETFKNDYPGLMDLRFAHKLGLDQLQSNDHALIEQLLQTLSTEQTDFPIFWRRLSYAVRQLAVADTQTAFAPVRDMFMQPQAWDQWLMLYVQRIEQQDHATAGERMVRTNPKYVLRNHLAQAAIEQAKMGDFAGVHHLHQALAQPFDEQPNFESFAAFPPDWASSISISCSS